MNYLDKIVKAVDLGIIDRGTLSFVNVSHDDGCWCLQQLGACTCDAYVSIEIKGKMYFITDEGTLLEEAKWPG